jgi:hypothetical protein
MINIKQFGEIEQNPFHYSGEMRQIDPHIIMVNQFTYTFQNYFHPFLGELIGRLNQTSVQGMLDPKFLASLEQSFFPKDYTPLDSPWVQVNYFDKMIDLALGGPYSVYNWELGYHIPMLVTRHLLNHQRFAEALRWLKLVFDPMCSDTSIPTPQRYWRFLGFYQSQDPCGTQNIGTLLALLSTPDGQLDATEIQCKKNILAGYQAIYDNPFQPHVVARTRTVAYQYYAVMTWLDIYQAWGDTLFQQGSMQGSVELINEATLCYVLMANFLGPRPQQIPTLGTTTPKNFLQLKQAGLDAMGNAMVEMESQFPFNQTLPSSPIDGGSDKGGPLFGVGRTLYFCIPPDPQLLGYWDIVADRLFKTRHCMDITGVVRPLPLFEPPIDPGMLVKAAAAGLDIGSIVSGLSQPLGPVRSRTLIQKALEIASEVRSLGSSLLAALEKGDAEQLALLRQEHEIAIQKATQNVRYLQWQHTQEATNALLRTRATALERFKYYLRLMNLTPDLNTAPDTFTPDRSELTEDNFDQTFATLVTAFDKTITPQTYPPLPLADGSSPSVQSGSTSPGLLYLNLDEDAELNAHLPTARDTSLASSALNAIAAGLTPIPDADVDLHFWGMGGKVKLSIGTALVAAAKIGGEVLGIVAGWEREQAGMASRKASHERRADEWLLQVNLAARELMQIGRQIVGSLVGEQVARHEYDAAKSQAVQAQELETFLQGTLQTTQQGTQVPGKVTTLDYYAWMQGQVSSLFYQYYRFAVDTARKAERTMKQELMRPELDATDFVQFNYWDAGHQGLLSGEALYLDVKRMEMAYFDNNKREIELTRNISLRQLDPLALLSLKITGVCTVTIPEWFYTLTCPSLYMLRIKSVAISVPSVVGPYTSLNCTLTQQKSTIRVSPLLANGKYQRDTSNPDGRFVDYFGSTDEIVTSSGSNNAGVHDMNAGDERFLPFEGSGAVSTWTLTLPTAFPPFDYMTISDLILQVRYTAREGGALLGTQASTELKKVLATQATLPLLFSLRFDFPNEWATFVSSGGGNFNFTMRRDHFPYMTQNSKLTVGQIVLYAQSGQTVAQRTLTDPQNWLKLNGDLNGTNAASSLSFPGDNNVLTSTPDAQVFLIVRYHLGS